MVAEVAQGSKAVLAAQKSDFRFGPVSGHPGGEEKNNKNADATGADGAQCQHEREGRRAASARANELFSPT